MPSVYEIVTEKIIRSLKSGVAPWRKPWTFRLPQTSHEKEYRGLNVFTLASQGFPSRFWLTYISQQSGRENRKGEKSSPSSSGTSATERETTAQTARKRPPAISAPLLQRVQFVAGRRHRYPRARPARDAHQRSHRKRANNS